MLVIIPIPVMIMVSPIVLTPIPAILPHFFPAHRSFVPALHGPRFIVVPIPVVAFRHAHEGPGHPVRLDPVKVRAGGPGAVPAIRSPTPVPAPMEEDFLTKAFHHLDSRLDHHQVGEGRQPEVDVDAHLRWGLGGAQGQEAGKGESQFDHGKLPSERVGRWMRRT